MTRADLKHCVNMSDAREELNRSVRGGRIESRHCTDYAKQHYIPHSWLPSKVMYPACSTKHFPKMTHSTQIHIYVCIHIIFIQRSLFPKRNVNKINKVISLMNNISQTCIKLQL